MLFIAALSLTLVFCAKLALAYPYPARDNSVHVQNGQSIQAAIDGAQPGTQITVGPGIYAEQLTITKDGISLVGADAMLIPPAVPVQNLCTGLAGNETSAGICVEGSGVELSPFQVEHRKVVSIRQPVKGVSITGFQIKGFDGENIAVVGGEDTQVIKNALYNGGQYGVLAAGSINTLISENAVISEGMLRFIGICIDNPATARVLGNQVSRYYVGLCIQTSGSELAYNDISSACVGASLDPGIMDIRLVHNHIGATDSECGALSPLTTGVFVYGAVNALVSLNTIEGQSAGGTAAGIVLVDALDATPPSIASGNIITQNVLLNNDFDIYVNTTGGGNVVTPNDCSTPAELCG